MALELPDTRSESNEVIEALRLRAVRARELGYPLAEIADILGVRVETVSRWCSKYQQGGMDALPGDRTGRPDGTARALTDKQELALQKLIDNNTPQALGINSCLWIRAAVRDLIRQQAGVTLSLTGVGVYLARWGYTPQKPLRKSYRQDPEEVSKWLETTYPEIKRRAKDEDADILWGDEMGVRSTCQNRRGYSRPQKTPELVVSGSRFSVNMISVITNQGHLQWMIYEGKMNSGVFIVFLGQLIAKALRKVFLVVDNLSVHDSQAVEDWLASRKGKIEVFYLPKYAPERNPDEYLNCDVKGNINADGLPKDRDELKAKLQRFMELLATLPIRIASYFRHRCIAYAAASP